MLTPLAMRAYSIAVAPLSCRMKVRKARRSGSKPSRSCALRSCSSVQLFRASAYSSAIRCDTSGSSAGGIVIVPQPVRFHPSKLWRFPGGDRSLPAPADIKRHQEMKVWVAVACESERRETVLADVDSQFLLELADQCLLRPLAVLDLAAGKLPQARHRLTFWPLCDEHAAIGIDEGAGGNQQDFGAHSPSPRR